MYHGTMNADSIASIASLIGDPSRAKMLISLFDVDALPASELARQANISPQATSAHLSKLCEGGLLKVEKHGRHRYYKLASPDVGEAVLALVTITPEKDEDTLASKQLEPINFARTCYDHLAGKLGVALTEALVKKAWVVKKEQMFEVTAKGQKEFQAFGIDTESLSKKRRKFAWQCLDWTERHYHLSGSLGAAITQSLLERKWLLQDKGSRVIHITNEGYKGLAKVFDIKL